MSPPKSGSASGTAMGANVESLKSMNANTSKFAKWYVRVSTAKVVPYTFMARSERVDATRFECVLVSNDATQYMFGSVPFDFREKDAATKAAEKYKIGTVWEITTPAFDPRAKPEYNGCPIKNVVLMTKPTTLKAVPPMDTLHANYPAKGPNVQLSISGIMKLLGQRTFVESSGSVKVPTKTFDFVGKFISLSSKKDIEKGGKTFKVATAEFVDEKGGKIEVGVWNEGCALLETLTPGVGVAIFGCNATKEQGEVKLSIWSGAHKCTDGEQAQSTSRVCKPRR